MKQGIDWRIDVSEAKPLPRFKRDPVFGMCAETRRQHREADKRRWHTYDRPYGKLRYDPEVHIEAYSKAIGVSYEEAVKRIASQEEHLKALIDETSWREENAQRSLERDQVSPGTRSAR